MEHDLKQTPPPGAKLLNCGGDTVTFYLETPPDLSGSAYLRTNLGNARLRRREIIKMVETEGTLGGRDWHDIPMKKVREGYYSLKLPLVETGWFAAKTLFIKSDGKVVWPGGKNITIKIEPANTCCHNTIYTVFPRQFGEIAKTKIAGTNISHANVIRELDNIGYAVIPPSGTFRDVIKELDFIIGTMNFRIIQLLPIFPVPTTFLRMGRYGSPFAATDFFNVDPSITEQVRDATPLEQFVEFADQVHSRGALVFIDLPANHTGWASMLQIHHPEWFKREKNGRFISPGAWGVVWEDLCELDYAKKELQGYMADVFLYWARRGVDGFRCDAGYMIPAQAWCYIVAKVRNEFPDTIFMLEGLGGKLSVTEELLSRSNLNWAYSELFQNYTTQEITSYIPFANEMSQTAGTMVHFAETHDNSRLAAVSKSYARMRTAMCALFSAGGAFGITNGMEWFATEKVDVHGASALNWGSEDNLVEFIKRINIILKNHPCFEVGARQRFIHTGGNAMAMLRELSEDGSKRSQAESKSPDGKILILVNVDLYNSASVWWDSSDFDAKTDCTFFDLLTGNQIDCGRQGQTISCEMPPAGVYALVSDRLYFDILLEWEQELGSEISHTIYKQRLNMIVQRVIIKANGFDDISNYDIEQLGKLFVKDSDEFFKHICRKDGYVPAVWWRYEADSRREVMLPPEHFLIATAGHHFFVELVDGTGKVIERAASLKIEGGKHIAVLDSFKVTRLSNTYYTLRMKVYKPDAIDTIIAPVMLLAENNSKICVDVNARQLLHSDCYALCRNDLGGMSQVRAKWGTLRSKYDALLAANCNPDYPVDRHIMLTRFRGWVIYRDYSREISVDCQCAFTTDMDNKVSWRFELPVGMGKSIPFVITLDLSKTDNSANIVFTRLSANCSDCLENDEIVKLVIRPDIEDRSNHNVTKAYEGPEFSFPGAVKQFENGFTFSPAGGRTLSLTVNDGGQFIVEPEWKYMVHLPIELQRGLESSTDLFSPGYFKIKLGGNESAVLRASISTANFESKNAEFDMMPVAMNKKWDIKELLSKAMSFYMVKRGDYKTVIAGYPWFLDWGRDTFIALRGFIAGGSEQQCRQIINQFARFEYNGTLPNMIRGNDVSNRDTTDAPLWMFTAVNDYIAKTGDASILSDDCNSRTLLEVLISIANGYTAGTFNGIKVDPETQLVFSPSHFTWMDTNYPAATPREGYPIEIQALWFAALDFLGRFDTDNLYKWQLMAAAVRKSVYRLYGGMKDIGLVDCLHARMGIGANNAVKDDALRPNQLLAVTLGLVEDRDLAGDVIRACSALIIPGSIRSLADRNVNYKLPVYSNGFLVNNPDNPYRGVYGGEEDTCRKPAYHNGTSWGWMFPSYCEAMMKIYGEHAKDAAVSIMLSVYELLQDGCIGHLPEICDGDFPHSQRGCKAQAWSVTEAYRIINMLDQQ